MFDKKKSKNFILVKGARVHNLKNLSVNIPRNRLVVITGLSGSGKSSLAFDTLFAEGQRRYIESLSSYARQFLGRMSKPDVDNIEGISPAIAVEQKANTRNPRSTVGTSTEIYEYMKLLFARIGKTISPVSGEIVKRNSVSDVVDYITSLQADSKVHIYTPFRKRDGRDFKEHLNILLQQGFTRLVIDDKIERIDSVLSSENADFPKEDIFLLIDRLLVENDDNGFSVRVADSAQTAFYEGDGLIVVEHFTEKNSIKKTFSNRFELDGISFEEPGVNMFSFNNPYGACKRCEGFGTVIGIDPKLVIPNQSLSIYEGGIACYRGDVMGEWREELIMNAAKHHIPVHKPYNDLDAEHKRLIWEGCSDFRGINDFFRMVEENSYKIQYRVLMSRYRGRTVCPDCKGGRLRPDSNYVKINGKGITDLVSLSASDSLKCFSDIKLGEHDTKVGSRLLNEITNRLQYLVDVGLGYLSLNRASNTLSGGESQRINLSTSLGSSLVGSMYILDEPSIGLHPRDTNRLIKVLKQLRDAGNSVIIVEHDEEIIKASDYIIDIGPEAGSGGGELVFEGRVEDMTDARGSYTADYICGRREVERASRKRKWKNFIRVSGAQENNLKNITVDFPLGVMTSVTGVSGSGKTSLVKHVLYPAVKKELEGHSSRAGMHDTVSGDIHLIGTVELVDQNSIGKSTRSNPVTYIKAWDDIRTMFSTEKLSQNRGYKPGMFSFNIAGGRCEECHGEGYVNIEMQFMADLKLICDSCKGKRFKDEILDVTINGKNVYEVLNMTVDESVDFFGINQNSNALGRRLTDKLKALQDVGLGYIKLGQSSSSLSGGEAQRLKLAFYLVQGNANKAVLFIFDEPTTGLHFHDIKKLMKSFNALLNNGHSLIIIEHNSEIIKNSDWIIDMGPEGGNGGGHIVFSGTPEEIINCENSYTGQHLKKNIKV